MPSSTSPRPAVSLALSLLMACSAFALAACGSADADGGAEGAEGEADVVVSQEAIEAVVGPEGGVLAAPGSHALAGFKVEIPAGALAAPVALSLEATVDDVPLGLLAERVGPQVRVRADGAALALPARVTLPLDRGLLDAWGQPSQCAVWQRTDAGWTKLPQVASTDATVTIETTSLNTVAAGIALTPQNSICTTNPSLCESVASSKCFSTSGFCVSKLPDLTRSMIDGTAAATVVQGGKAYYLHAPAAGQITVARYDLASGATAVYQGVSAPSTVPLKVFGRIAVEADDSVWVSTSFGNLHLRTGAQAEIFEATSGGAGVVVAGGVTTRFFSKRVVVSKIGTTQDRVCSVSPAGCATVASRADLLGVEARLGATAAQPGAPGFLLLSRSQGAATFNTLSLLTPLSFFGPLPPQHVNTAPRGMTGMATSPISAAVGLIQSHFSFEGAQFSIATRQASPSDAPALQSTSDGSPSVAFADDDVLFAVGGSRPDFIVVRPDGTFGAHSLSTAAPGEPEFNRMLPRAVARIPGAQGLMLLVTRGTVAGKPEFYQIRRSGG